MRLISLYIENFRVLRDVKLNFTDQVIGLIGRNGSGKSSIIEAIAWALYGNQAARSGKGEIKSTFATENDICQVSLEFEIHTEKYRVVRQLIGKSQRAEVHLYRGEKSESVGVSETKGYIGELLGLDWQGFLTSFLARQQELNALTDLQPAKRKDHLAGMLGIGRLDRAISNIKEENKITQTKAEMIQQQLQEKAVVESQTRQLAEQSKGLAPKVVAAESLFNNAEKEFNVIADTLKEIQGKQSTFERLKAELSAHQKTEQLLQLRIKDLTDEIISLSESQERIAVLTEQLKELAPTEESIDRLKQAGASVELRKKLTDDIDTATKDLLDNESSLKNVLSETEVTKNKLFRIPKDIDQSVEENQKLLEQDREQYTTAVAELKALNEQQVKLQMQISQIEQLGVESVCDRCQRPLGKDINEIRAHFDQELKKFEESQRRLSELKSSLASQGKERKEKLLHFEQENEARKEGLQKKDQLSKQEVELKNQAEKLKKQKARIEGDLARVGEIVYDPTQLVKLQSKLADLQKLRTEKERLEGKLTRLSIAEKDKDKATEQLASEGEMVVRSQKEIDSLQFSSEQYKTVVEKHATAQQNRETSRDAHIQLKQRLELVKSELRGKQELLEKLTVAEKQLKEIQITHFHGAKLASLFSDFRGDLIARIRPTLADISSRLMTEMTDGRYTLVELDEKYDLQVMDNGVFYGVDRFSGGEKDLANLCLRLAISQALTQSAGLDRSFIILDEVFGSQDDGRKELILHALSRLKQFFPQILLITHIEDIRERVESLVDVVPSGLGWSGVKIRAS